MTGSPDPIPVGVLDGAEDGEPEGFGAREAGEAALAAGGLITIPERDLEGGPAPGT